MDNERNNRSERLKRRNLGLDLIGLSDEEREEGSIFIGGSSKEFVGPDDEVVSAKLIR